MTTQGELLFLFFFGVPAVITFLYRKTNTPPPILALTAFICFVLLFFTFFLDLLAIHDFGYGGFELPDGPHGGIVTRSSYYLAKYGRVLVRELWFQILFSIFTVWITFRIVSAFKKSRSKPSQQPKKPW